jgi:hypothetical protein
VLQIYCTKRREILRYEENKKTVRVRHLRKTDKNKKMHDFAITYAVPNLPPRKDTFHFSAKLLSPF